MKNICFLIGDMNLSGGTERVTSIIANELAKEHCKVSILSLNNGIDSFFQLDESIALHSLYTKKVSMKKNFLGCCFKIRKFMQSNHIDTLIVVDSISCVFTVPALWGLKINHICWEHFNFNVNLGVKFRDIGRKWAAKYCNYIVTLTKRDKELWLAGLSFDKINAKIIPIANPTPYENMNYTPSLSSKTVLAMGRLTYQKGFDMLIDAWAEVCKINSDWTLKIVGSGEDNDKLKQQVLDLNLSKRVEFIPVTSDVVSHYKNASIYCLSSRFEGFGMVILEAQSFGLPIVSFDCDCGPSDLIYDGVNGLLVEKDDTRLLAKSIIRLMDFNDVDYKKVIEFNEVFSKKFYVSNLINQWLLIL